MIRGLRRTSHNVEKSLGRRLTSAAKSTQSLWNDSEILGAQLALVPLIHIQTLHCPVCF